MYLKENLICFKKDEKIYSESKIYLVRREKYE